MLGTIDLNRDLSFFSEHGVTAMTATPQPAKHMLVDGPRPVSVTG